MLNHITIMGRLTRDPELRYTQSGIAVASFTVAVDRDFQPKDGGEKQTDFISVVAWRSTGEFVSKYFNKGSMIVVAGRLQMRDWTDRDGNKRTSAEIVADNVYFGESRRRDDSSGGGYRQSEPPRQSYGGNGGYSSGGDNGYGSGSSGYSSGFNSASGGGSAFRELDDEDDGELPF